MLRLVLHVLFIYLNYNYLSETFIIILDQFGPSIIVNPRVQTAIKGDANIARFLCRKFLPHLFESLDENGTLIADFLMDLATTKVSLKNDNLEDKEEEKKRKE